jgi:hypothetical protein
MDRAWNKFLAWKFATRYHTDGAMVVNISMGISSIAEQLLASREEFCYWSR